MADELDQQYMRTRQAMRQWQGQIFEEVDTGDPIVVPQEGGPTQVYMGTVRRMKPQEGTGTDPNAPKAEAPPTITPAPVKPGPHEQTIVEAATKYGIDPNLLRAVVQEESGGRPGAVSKKGAQGVMQLMPETAAALGVTDPLDPVQSIEGGAKYIAQLLTKYEGDAVTALAAYNFGPGNIAKGKPYPKETKNYIEKILSHLPTDVSAEAGEAPVGEEAVGITPRREFTVDTPEMQQQKQRIRGEFEDRIAPWKFDLSTFDVPGDVLRAGLAKLSGVDRGEKEGQLRMSSDEMVERVFFKYGDKPQEVIKQAEALGLDEAQTLKIMAGLSAVVLGAVMDPLNVAGPGGKGKDVAKLAKVAGEAGAANYKKWFEQVAIKAVQEEKGQAVLDQLDELGKTPKQVIQEFWAQTYPQLPDAVKERFHQTIKKLTSMEPGAVVAVGPNKEEVRAADWAQALGEDFGPRAEDLEGTERGMIALMEMANQRRTAATGQIEDKATILSEFQRAAKIIKEERGSVPLGGGVPPPGEIPPARIGGPADEPLSSKQLALLSKREESRQNYGFKVEGFEEELTKQRRGPVLSDEAVQKLAAESGFTLEDLMYLKPGSVLAPEIQLAAREVYRAAADRMTTSAKTYLAMPTPENMEDFAQAFTQAGLATTRIIGTFAESGRTMRLLNQKVPGMAKAGEAQAHDPQFRIQDAYIKQMYEFFRQAEAKSKMGGFAGPVGQAAQPGVVTPGQLAQMVVELPSEEAVMNFAKAAIKPTWSDMLYEVWINGLLSGPVTHATNIISNAATIAWNIPERAVASMLHPQTVRPGEAAAMMGGVMESVGDAWRMAWKAFKEDAPQFGQGKLEMPTRAITADAFDFTGDVGRAIDYLGITAPVKSLINVTGAGLRLPGRTLMAADDFFKAIAFRAELRALAKRESFKQINELGLTGKEAAKTAKEIEHRILADPPEHIKEAAQDFAAYTTFTRELGETGKAWQQAIHKTPMMRVAVPFIRTPANIFKFAGERTPFALASKAVVAELKAGGERAALAQAKIALGSMTMGLVAMYTASGMITGGGPKDKALRKQWEDDGWQPYSIKIGNEYYSYARIEPFGSLIGMAADATEIMGQLDEKQAEELAAALAMAVSRNFSNKTFVKGLSGTLNAAMGNDVNVWKGFLEKELPTILPYSSALGQTAKVVDPVQREVRSILGAVKAKVPGWSDSLQAELNLWGETKPQRTAVGPDFISPIYSSVYKDDPVINEMNRLEKAFTVPSRAVGGLKPGSADLPDATYWRYVELSAGKDNLIKGMNLHDKIHKTITAPMYGMATKEGQIAYIQSDIDLFRQAAMLRLRKENPEFDKAMLRQEFKEKTKKSAATQERVLAAPRLQ